MRGVSIVRRVTYLGASHSLQLHCHRPPSSSTLGFRSPFSSAHPTSSASSPSTSVSLQLRHRAGPHLNDRTPGDERDNAIHHILQQHGLPALIFPPLDSSPSSPSPTSLSASLLALQQQRIGPLLSAYERLYPLPTPPPRHRPVYLPMDDPAHSTPTPTPSPLLPSPSPLFPSSSPMQPLSMMELVQLISSTLSSSTSDSPPPLSLIHQYMSSYDASLGEWRRFAFVDASKRYTRNLIATDYATYTLMLLCWNPRLGSPVHDHAASECFMRVIEGQVVESQFLTQDQSKDGEGNEQPALSASQASSTAPSATLSPASWPLTSPSSSTTPLRLRRRVVAKAGSVLFINDGIGLHKIDNPFDAPAVTLHCYIPPYDSCRCYEEDTGSTHTSFVSFHSEQGELLTDH